MDNSWQAMLDEHDPAVKMPVTARTNEDWDAFAKIKPAHNFQDAWGAHEDLPMGLDLSEVAS